MSQTRWFELIIKHASSPSTVVTTSIRIQDLAGYLMLTRLMKLRAFGLLSRSKFFLRPVNGGSDVPFRDGESLFRSRSSLHDQES